MSVINDMLRDLETRKASSSDGTVSTDQVQSMIEQEGKSPLLMAGGITIIAAIALGLFFAFSGEPSSETPNIAADLQTDKALEASEEATPSANPTQKISETPTAAQITSNKADDAKDTKTNTVKNSTAQNSTAKDVIAKNSATKSTTAKKSTPQRTAVADKSKSKRTDSSTSKKQISKPQATIAKTETKKSAPPKKAAAPTKASAPAKTVSAKAMDSQNAKAAQALFQKGDDQTAYALLNTFIAENQQTTQSRSVLLTYLMRDQRIDEAGKLLATLPVESDPALRQIKARWLVAKGDTEQALFTLHSQLPSMVDYPDYYALLASYYQQFGHPDKAVGMYTQLVQLDNQSANWWAGLAVALDSIGQQNEARIAYDQAAQLPGLRPELMGFIAQRAEQLSR